MMQNKEIKDKTIFSSLGCSLFRIQGLHFTFLLGCLGFCPLKKSLVMVSDCEYQK